MYFSPMPNRPFSETDAIITFEKSFNKLKQDGAADARGKSVEQAQNSVKAKVAGEKMAKTLKSAKESIENDLKKHGITR